MPSVTDWDIHLLERIAIGNHIDADDNESATDARDKLISIGRWSADLEGRHQRYLAEVHDYCKLFK
jgi:hypothetical protein